jgi:galactose-1-phosphate uridylyltransferase
MASQQLSTLTFQPNLEHHNFKSMLDFLVADHHVKGHGAKDLCQLDPRDGAMIIYAEHRSLRRDEHQAAVKPATATCPICSGQLTNVIDYAPQSEGFTFISQNMFPVLYPKNLYPNETAIHSLYPDPQHHGRIAFGFHLLQWTSSFHDRDWHNLPLSDVLITMQRLQALEAKLLLKSGGYMPLSEEANGIHGFVSIIKNYGAGAGASLTHGHQQIAFSNIMPQHAYNNCKFFERHQRTFSEYLWHENPDKLTVFANDTIKVVIPYFMSRPFNVIVLLNTEAQHLHQLEHNTLVELTTAMQRVIKTYHTLLGDLGREVSYNMAINTGPNNHVHVEFFPIVQAMGGFERIGMWICQLSADNAAQQMREYFDKTT